MHQRTIKQILEISGIGLHSGKTVNMKLIPAPADSGIVFKRVDILDNEESIIPARYDLVRDTKLCTMLINDLGAKVGTIEHLMSALAYLKINNLLIEINSFEVPILDGSARVFIEEISKVGIADLSEPRKVLKILKPVSLKTDKWEVKIVPHESSFVLNVEIEFNNAVIGKQNYSFDINNDDYYQDISKARTFCLEQEIAYLQSAGLALGGSLDNAIVVGKEAVLNPEGLRYKEEFARHKLLDALGDLYLCGYEIQGEFSGIKCGHESNNLLLREIFKDASNYEIVADYSSMPLFVATARGIAEKY
ncbi:MAG: UDP-3-O-acyl-N-acetylglucosamine deacetylase [Alphaproteobacteria bacterium]|jgi:UDP-3-O-[3-hydroxymyristoyl] N-acetylglucosamine deacetylase|nr:UDP-3-O-acyl-N-acetylglucosamine deacetylase [Alphaproteobacteria bacterium]